jgi:Holliday junction DNA helicase RuvA
MIAQLRGQLVENDGDAVVIDVGGVGYQVLISAATLGALPPVGSEAHVFVHSHYVADEPLRLYGFAEAGERRLFQTLIAVQGVGPRVGLAILAGLPPGELVRAIAGGDVARLTQIKGVGRKIAERLTVELREKITALPLGREAAAAAGGGATAAARPAAQAGPLGDVFGALVGLGYKPGEIEALLADMDPSRPTEDLVRQALAALRKR